MINAPKTNRKYEILLVKTFSEKQKVNQIIQATMEKIKFCHFKPLVSLNIKISDHTSK